MSYTQKDWQDTPGTATPLSAAAMEDLEMRTTDYVEEVSPSINVWESEANPASVTDWGTVINSLLAAGYRELYFNENDFPFSTAIVFTASTKGCVFRGASSGGGAYGDTTTEPTRLIWKGTGSGYAIDGGSTAGGNFTEHGAAFHDMLIGYDSASYTGKLIYASSGMSFHKCRIRNIAPAAREAACLVDMDTQVGAVFDHCFLLGAQDLIRGPEPLSFSNQASFKDCVFGGMTDRAICNPGVDWTFLNCAWEYPGSGSTATAFGSDYTSGEAGDYSVSFTLIGCTFWDQDSASQTIMEQPVGVEWNFTMERCNWYASNSAVAVMQLLGPGRVMLRDCGFGGAQAGVPAIDLGDVGVNGDNSRKSIVDIRNCAGGDAQSGPGVTNVEGHHYVNIQSWGIALGGSPAREPHLRTVSGYERLWAFHTDDQRPTISGHGGYGGEIIVSEYSSLTDGAGVIAMSSGAGGAAAGLALDVTFGTPLAPAYRSSNVQRPYLTVVLQPMAIEGAYADAGDLAAAHPYVQVANSTYSDAGTITEFSIGFSGTIAGEKEFALAYRVLQL